MWILKWIFFKDLKKTSYKLQNCWKGKLPVDGRHWSTSTAVYVSNFYSNIVFSVHTIVNHF